MGVGFFTATPLFQTNFFPDFKQVKVLFPTTDLMPTLVHLAPALVVACAGTMESVIKRENIDKKPIAFLFIRGNTIQEDRKMKGSLIYFSLALSESVVKAAMNAS